MFRGAWLLAPALGALAIACRQIVGITDNAPEELTTDVCGLPYGTAACAACVHTSCCAESNSCAADPSCAAYQACFGPCNGDPACWSQCIIDHPATGADVSALSVCLASQCESACDLTCGGFAGRPFPPSTAAACKSCLAQTACTQTRACATSVGCDTAIRCINASPTYDLISTCELADGVNPSWGWNPDAGSDSALTQSFIAESSCGPACSGADWHCVGHVNWPQLRSVSTPYTMNLFVRDYSSSSPEPGATVEVCGDTDIDCTMSYAHGTTDPNGEISLPFQNVPAASAVAHGLEGYLKISRADLETSYTYWGFPLSGSAEYTLAEVTTLSELAALYRSIKVTPDPTRGSVTVATYDCQYGPALGVQVTLDTADSDTRSFSTTGATTTATDSSDLIIFTNVPAGPVQVTATPPGLNRASSHVSATVRSQAITIVIAYPTP